MEKSPTRNSYSDSHSQRISIITADAHQFSTAQNDVMTPDPRNTTTNTHPITVLQGDELFRVRRALGATRPRPYSSSPRRSSIWPPRHCPDGLYRDVVTARCKSQYFFYFVSTLYNSCIILQILLGASLTALGSVSSKHGLAIVVLAAANTVIAGVLALLHNSGLPERIRSDWNTYAAVELQLVELLNTGVIQGQMPEKGDLVSNVIAWAFTLFTNAKLTEQNNKPSTYIGSGQNQQSTLQY